MKKITLLLVLFVASIGLNAQTWDFNSSKDGWANLSATQTLKDTYWELTSKDGVKNPGLKLSDATELGKIDVSAVHILAITMKNHSATGPVELRTAATTEGGTIYLSSTISTGDTDYKTYFVDFSTQAAKWTGAVSEIKLLFKAAGNTDFIGTGNEVFDIDKIEMLDAIPVTEKHVFTFDTDGDAENWAAVNGSIDGVSGGILTYSPKVNKYAKLEQRLHYVVADEYNWLRVKIKNNSTGDNLLTLITSIARINIPITTADGVEQTYEVLLDTIGVGANGVTTWTGNAQDITLRFGSDTNGKSTGTGTFDINSIEFFKAPGLSNDDIVKDDTQLVIYPNPVRNSLTVITSSKLNSLQIFNVTGQEVLRTESSTVNTSSLGRGVYILKVSQEGGVISTKRFIKE